MDSAEKVCKYCGQSDRFLRSLGSIWDKRFLDVLFANKPIPIYQKFSFFIGYYWIKCNFVVLNVIFELDK